MSKAPSSTIGRRSGTSTTTWAAGPQQASRGGQQADRIVDVGQHVAGDHRVEGPVVCGQSRGALAVEEGADRGPPSGVGRGRRVLRGVDAEGIQAGAGHGRQVGAVVARDLQHPATRVAGGQGLGQPLPVPAHRRRRAGHVGVVGEQRGRIDDLGHLDQPAAGRSDTG
ncbi:MAG: hypothetical protein H6742_17180 [Alphaproteobacteria bacterium]|nr:hypothetical protein [Alphaproteobacteria bacterium]